MKKRNVEIVTNRYNLRINKWCASCEHFYRKAEKNNQETEGIPTCSIDKCEVEPYVAPCENWILTHHFANAGKNRADKLRTIDMSRYKWYEGSEAEKRDLAKMGIEQGYTSNYKTVTSKTGKVYRVKYK